MPTTVAARPGPVNFTDNQARYTIIGDFTTPAQKLQVRVFVTNTATPVGTFLYPPYDGTFAPFNVQEVVRPFTTFFRPRIDGSYYSAIQAATGHRAKVWIEHRVFDPTSDTNPPFTSDADNAVWFIRGGYGLWNKLPNFVFEHPRKWFFTWQPAAKLVGEQEPNWLLYCHPIGTPADLEYRIYYTDGTESVLRSEITGTTTSPADKQFNLWFLPTGVEQCDLKAAQPEKMIFRYLVRVLRRDTSEALAEYAYKVDYRPNYDALVVYFRNSLGGWDSLRILGEYEEGSNYNRKDHQRPLYTNTIADYGSSGTTPYYKITERRKWEVNTGHLDKDEMDALRDMMISTEIATIVSGHWVPLRITNQERTGINTRSGIQDMSFELEESFENENYTPDTLPWAL